jgi:hypothetical protein
VDQFRHSPAGLADTTGLRAGDYGFGSAIVSRLVDRDWFRRPDNRCYSFCRQFVDYAVLAGGTQVRLSSTCAQLSSGPRWQFASQSRIAHLSRLDYPKIDAHL